MEKDRFIPGLILSGHFFDEAIQPLMTEHFPQIPYAAARLDYGSDVIGFDTPMSMDHGWGPRMTLFLEKEDYTNHGQDLDEIMAHNLPLEIHGFPTHFEEPLEDGGVMQMVDSHPIQHMVSITTPEKFFQDYLGVNMHQPLTPRDWLAVPQQKLRTLRAGRIYHDDLKYLSEWRQRWDWYPHDLWLYLMAAQWQRIDQDEPFIGRTGVVGDEIGSRLLTARIIRDLMRLAFLMEKQYAPYHKWFGSAFKKLKMAQNLNPIFQSALDAQDWKTREKHLSSAYILLANKHNALNLTPSIPAEVSNFYNRPFLVLHSARFVDALLAEIKDPSVQSLPPRLGSIDQIIDNTDVLENNQLCQKINDIYQ